MRTLTEQIAILKASGYVYRNGMRNRMEFQHAFGFDPQNLPMYFGITSKGLVFCKEKFLKDIQARDYQVQANWNAIGITNT